MHSSTIIFYSKIILYLCSELGNHHVYLHQFLTPIFAFTVSFLGITQFLNFFLCYPWIWRLGTPNIFVKKLHKDLCNELKNHHVYTYTILLMPISAFTNHISDALENPKLFSEKPLWGITTYTHLIFNAYLTLTSFF